MLFIQYGFLKVAMPSMFVLLGTIAMVSAEFLVSPIVHRHYLSVDQVLQRTITFLFTFSVIFFLLCSVHRWTLGEIVPGKGVGMASVWVAVGIIVSRVIEFFLIRMERSKGRNSRALAFVGDVEDIENILLVGKRE